MPMQQRVEYFCDHMSPDAKQKWQSYTFKDLQELTTEEITAIAKALKSNNSLEVLRFVNCKIDAAGIKTIADALKNNKKLITLDFSGTKISKESAEAIFEGLKHNRDLQELNLTNCSIDDDGANAIANVIKNTFSLKTLNLSQNNITITGAKEIAKALEKNKTLKILDLQKNNIGNDGATVIADALDSNYTLQKVDLPSNIDSTIVERINRSRKRLRMFLYLEPLQYREFSQFRKCPEFPLKQAIGDLEAGIKYAVDNNPSLSAAAERLTKATYELMQASLSPNFNRTKLDDYETLFADPDIQSLLAIQVPTTDFNRLVNHEPLSKLFIAAWVCFALFCGLLSLAILAIGVTLDLFTLNPTFGATQAFTFICSTLFGALLPIFKELYNMERGENIETKKVALVQFTNNFKHFFAPEKWPQKKCNDHEHASHKDNYQDHLHNTAVYPFYRIGKS